MNRLRAVGGYTLAFLGVPFYMVIIFGLGAWMTLLVSTTGLKVTPWFTGGEVASTVQHERYRTEIHRPVFDALIGERSEGFVQVSWTPDRAVPLQVEEAIDYNADGRPEFAVQVITEPRSAVLTSSSPGVVRVEGPYHLKDAWAVRVILRK